MSKLEKRKSSLKSAAAKNRTGNTISVAKSLLSGPFQTDPFLIDSVLRRIFCFADYNTLKDCRLICKQWKELSQPKFIQKSAFVYEIFRKGLIAEEFESEDNLRIESIFKSITFANEITFTAFKYVYDSLTPSDLEDCLKPYKMMMTQLEISNISGGRRKLYNLDNLIGPNLQKVKLNNSGFDRNWFISVSKVASISYIDFSGGILVKDSNAKISPKELKLDNFLIKVNDEIADSIEINEIIDFSQLEKLYIRRDFYERIEVAPILNLRDCSRLKCLTLFRIKINLNGIISPEVLQLWSNHYFKRNVENVTDFPLYDYLDSKYMKRMEVKDFAATLDIRHEISIDELHIVKEVQNVSQSSSKIRTKVKKLVCHSSIDLYTLPDGIESLIISCKENVKCSKPVSFQNLKSLKLRSNLNSLGRFKNCPCLVDVMLHGNGPSDGLLNVDRLPETIKRLALLDIYGINVTGKNVYNLNVLFVGVTSTQNWESVKYTFEYQLFERFKADTYLFYIEHDKSNEFTSSSKHFQSLLEMKQKMKIENIAFGPCVWESDDVFQKSPLSKIVDQKSDFYLLEDQSGKTISEANFYSMIPFGKEELIDYSIT